jgi:hypothetical protein
MAERLVNRRNAKPEPEPANLKGGDDVISLHEKGAAYKRYQFEKAYTPGPSAAKKPLTDPLTELVRMRGFKMAWALVKSAEKGNVNAWREIADRVEGKVAETVDVTHTVQLSIAIQEARARRDRMKTISATATAIEPQKQLTNGTEPKISEITTPVEASELSQAKGE